MAGFWVAMSDADGLRVTGSELQLSPAPVRVDYDQEPAGTIIETADGAVVHQQPTFDPRRKQWEWSEMPATQAGYLRVWPVLESLRSRTRKELGFSPYVYLKDEVTNGLRTRQTTTGTGSGSGFTFTTTGLTPSAHVGGFVACNDQVRAILGNTATTVNVGDAWSGTVTGDFTIVSMQPAWLRCRVLEVSRRVAEGKKLNYASTRIVFVVDDEAWEEVG